MPCLGPPIGGLFDVAPPMYSHVYPFPTHEAPRFERLNAVCDLRDTDPNAILALFKPSRCSCESPRFDTVTIGGVRHTQFCCACGKPGPDDHAC